MNLFNTLIQNTYQTVVNTTDRNNITDGTGSAILTLNLTASRALTAISSSNASNSVSSSFSQTTATASYVSGSKGIITALTSSGVQISGNGTILSIDPDSSGSIKFVTPNGNVRFEIGDGTSGKFSSGPADFGIDVPGIPNGGFYYDNNNGRLGIGNSIPQATLDVTGNDGTITNSQGDLNITCGGGNLTIYQVVNEDTSVILLDAGTGNIDLTCDNADINFFANNIISNAGDIVINPTNGGAVRSNKYQNFNGTPFVPTSSISASFSTTASYVNLPYRAGQQSIGNLSTSQIINFSSPFTTSSYAVSLTADSTLGAAISFAAIGKTNAGFTASLSSGIAGGVTVDYIAYLNK